MSDILSIDLDIEKAYSSTVKVAQKMQFLLIIVGIIYGSFITPHIPDFLKDILMNPFVRAIVLLGIILSIQPNSYHLGILLVVVYFLAVRKYKKDGDCEKQ